MERKYKNINSIGIATIVGAVGVEMVNFLLIPIMTRELGTSGYGTISIYTAWCAIILAVCGLQTTQSIVYIIADKDIEEHRRYYASMLACSFFAFLISAILVTIVSSLFAGVLWVSTPLVILMFLQAFGNYCVNYANTIFTQEQKPIKQVMISFLVASSTALLSIALVYSIKDPDMKYWGRIVGYAVPYFCVGVALASYFILPEIRNIKLQYIRELLPLCLPVIIHSLSGIVFAQSDRVMLGYISGSSDAGVYSFAYSIASLLSVSWVTLNSIYQPFFFAYMSNRDYNLIKEKTKNLIELYTAIYVIFVMLVPEFMSLYGGANFVMAKKYLPILSLGVYFNFLYVFNSNFELFYKETRIVARATTIAAITNIVLNAILIPKCSVWGASMATLASCITLFCIHLFAALSISRAKKVYYVFGIKHFVIGSVFACGTVLVYYYLPDSFFSRSIICAIIFVYIMGKICRRKSII